MSNGHLPLVDEFGNNLQRDKSAERRIRLWGETSAIQRGAWDALAKQFAFAHSQKEKEITIAGERCRDQILRELAENNDKVLA